MELKGVARLAGRRLSILNVRIRYIEAAQNRQLGPVQ